jgi:hypothetical protein
VRASVIYHLPFFFPPPDAGNQPLTPNPAPFRPRSPPRPWFGSPFPSFPSVEFLPTHSASLPEFTRAYPGRPSISTRLSRSDMGCRLRLLRGELPARQTSPALFFGLTGFDRANCGIVNPAIFAGLRLPFRSRHQLPTTGAPKPWRRRVNFFCRSHYAAISGNTRQYADDAPFPCRVLPPNSSRIAAYLIFLPRKIRQTRPVAAVYARTALRPEPEVPRLVPWWPCASTSIVKEPIFTPIGAKILPLPFLSRSQPSTLIYQLTRVFPPRSVPGPNRQLPRPLHQHGHPRISASQLQVLSERSQTDCIKHLQIILSKIESITASG